MLGCQHLFRFTSFATLLGGTSAAIITLPSVFSDGVVLQRDATVKIWGQSDSGESVTVQFNTQTVNVVASASGDWEIQLAPMDANATPQDMIITGVSSAMVTVSNVRVGEVWLGSGQSNMQRSLSGDQDYDAARTDLVANINNYDLHFFDVTKNGGSIDTTTWEEISVDSASDFSAIMYYFGREMAKHGSMASVPIGLMTSAVGATAIERWATCAGSGGLYTNRIVGMQPFTIRAVIWYQGEWDARPGGAENYYDQLECLIEEWRGGWEQSDLPFYVVQMPKMNLGQIHVIRDAELHNYLLDDLVHMIVTLDFPDGGDQVHPPKGPFGKRLADLALLQENSQVIEALSPIHDEGQSFAESSEIHIVFENVYAGLSTTTGTPEAEWEISDGSSWYEADTYRIEDTDTTADTVVVSSTEVSCPVSARYAFQPLPVLHDLVNSANLPASPIRDVTPMRIDTCGGSSGCTGNGDCDNGAFCDGAETCVGGTCQAGTPVVCDDEVACTVDSCNESTETCDYTPDDAFCDNGAFCDGVETCDAASGCQAGTAPSCTHGCDESQDQCFECTVDGDCADDGLFCNGLETCPSGYCVSVGNPCPQATICNDTTDICDPVSCHSAGTSCIKKNCDPSSQDCCSDCCSWSGGKPECL